MAPPPLAAATCLEPTWLRLLFERSEQSIVVWRVEDAARFVCEAVNPRAELVLGSPRARLEGRPIEEVVSPARIEQLRVRLSHCVATSREQTDQGTVLAGAAWLSIVTRMIPLCDARGRVSHIVSLSSDPAEQRRGERGQSDAEQTFNTAIRTSPQQIIITELESGRVIEANDSFIAAFGAPREALLGKTTLELGFWRDPEDRKRAVALVMERGVLRDFEVKSRTFRGIPSIHRISTEPIELAGVSCVVTVLQDITEQKRAEQALRESEEKFSKVFWSSPFSISVVDAESGRYIDVNGGFERLFGITRAEAIGHTTDELGVGGDPGDRERLQVELAKTGSVREFPGTGHHRDGSLIHGLVSAEVIEIGGRRAVILTVRDVSQQRAAEHSKAELEAQLRQAQKLEALGTLAGGIAHDFNNILAAIVAYTELIRMDSSDPSAISAHADELDRAADRAKDLVQQILTFSRRQKQERRPTELGMAVRQALKLLRSTLPASIEILSFVDPHTPVVLADLTQVHQIVMNLGTNAAHAMRRQPGTLTVRLEGVDVGEPQAQGRPDLRAGRHARLTVRDSGEGMSQETLKRIFEPFFTTKAPGEGTGLGLAVVHGIVREHEGAVNVHSEPNAGTSFEIYFPEHPAELLADAELPPTLPRGSERVLLVEDETSLRHAIGRVLERLGYRVTAKENPRQALEAFEQSPAEFDVLLSDLTMPGMSGIEMARRLLEAHPTLPVVVMSGFMGSWTSESLIALGIRELIAKPIAPRELAVVLRRVLGPSKP